MLLSGALFALFMTGFWLYCLTDAILTPAAECRGLPKAAWVVIITVTFIGGAIAWLIVRQPVRSSSPLPLTPPSPWDPESPDDEDSFRIERWTDADDAVARHPAGRARTADAALAAPKGPDDDLDFLRALDRVIRGNSQAGEEV
jgi:Phospholipase_D-nuclease N-terminal